MPQHMFNLGGRSVVGSFAEGFRIVRSEPVVRETDDSVFAYALWLVRHKSEEEAEEYLEKYLRRNSTTQRH